MYYYRTNFPHTMEDRGKHEHWLGNLLQDLMPCTEYKWNINFVGESWNVLGCSWRQFEMMNEFSIFHFHSVNGKFPFDNFNSYSLFTLILKFSNSPYISSHFYRLHDFEIWREAIIIFAASKSRQRHHQFVCDAFKWFLQLWYIRIFHIFIETKAHWWWEEFT